MKKMFSAYSDPNYDKIEVSFQIQFMKKKSNCYFRSKSWKIYLFGVDISVVLVWTDIVLVVTCTVKTQAVKPYIKLNGMFVFFYVKIQLKYVLP